MVFVLDRGPARYFHGRSRIIERFEYVSHQLCEQNSGTTFLVQGPPGAGKTALLAECAKRMQAAKWQVLKIRSNSLHDPAALMEAQERPYISERVRSRGVSAANYAHKSFKTHSPGSSVTAILKEASSESPLLLILDEVQNIAENAKADASISPIIRSTLEYIHNGDVGNSVMLLAGGLGTSLSAFESLGISRFDVDCVVELGSLSKNAEHAIIDDWLTMDGQAQGSTSAWIDAITQETHGWPQHIMSFVKPALEQLHRDSGQLSEDGLNAVLQGGIERRITYYLGRVASFDREQLECLTQAVSASGISKKALIDSIARQYSQEEAQELFFQALQKGVLARRDGQYVVPIPSMYSWLKDNYSTSTSNSS